MELEEDSVSVLVGLMSCEDPEVRTEAVRTVKNQIIGNRVKKAEYVNAGAFEVLLKIVDNASSDPNGAVQAIAALGSLACRYKEGYEASRKSSVVKHILACLDSPYTPVVESSLRALKIMFTMDSVGLREELFIGSPSPPVDLLVRFITLENESMAEASASVLARCSFSAGQQEYLRGNGVVLSLKRHLYTASHPAMKTAALNVLIAVSRGNAGCAAQLVSDQMDEPVLRLVRDQDPAIRLLACKLLSNLVRSDVGFSNKKLVSSAIVPGLVRLISEGESPATEASLTLGELVEKSEPLQKSACDANAISSIAKLLNKKEKDVEVLVNSLVALAALSSLREESRKTVIDEQLLPTIVESLKNPNPRVRSAAASCIRSLSRSVKNIRTSLVDAGVAEPLFGLLNDSNLEVQLSASAPICNIVLDFTPMKQTFIDRGGVGTLVKLTDSSIPLLKLNAVWALKNLLFMADMKIKKAVINVLTFDRIWRLLHCTEVGVREQAISLLRNLSYTKEGNSDTLDILDEFGGLFEVLQELLTKSESTEAICQALYVVCNIATSPKHKLLLMSSCLLEAVLRLTHHSEDRIRLAAVWCIVNLSWRSNPPGNARSKVDSDELKESQRRIGQLREMGFEKRLAEMSSDPHPDVRYRAKICLENFRYDFSESVSRQLPA